MKNLRVINFILSLIISILIFYRAHAIENIMIPNPNMIGKSAYECKIIFLNRNENTSSEYPLQIIFDLKNEKISGMITYYDKTVPYVKVVQSIDCLYGKWEKKDLRIDDLRLYRVETENFVINLSRDEDDITQLIFLPIGGFEFKCGEDGN